MTEFDLDPNILRDAARYIRHRACTSEHTCLQVLYEFRPRIGDDGTLIVVHKLYKANQWASPKSYSYEDLEQFAKMSGSIGND